MPKATLKTYPTVEHLFPELALHHPDCTGIPDTVLSSVIHARWSQEKGVITIPYGFPKNKRWNEYADKIHFRDAEDRGGFKILPPQSWATMSDYVDNIKDTIRFVLDKWTQASKNKIIFVEQSKMDLSAYGIFFILADTKENLYKKTGGDALTMYEYGDKLDLNFNTMKRAFVFLPTNKKLWDSTRYPTDFAWTMRSCTHEIGHALGFTHPHYFPEIMTTLNARADGIYCSAMLYQSKINSAAHCKQSCTPGHGVTPGSLDEQLLRVAYHDENPEDERCSDQANVELPSIEYAEPFIATSGVSPQISLELFLNTHVFINTSLLDEFLHGVQHAIEKVVTNCESYFPKNTVQPLYHTVNQSSFFKMPIPIYNNISTPALPNLMGLSI